VKSFSPFIKESKNVSFFARFRDSPNSNQIFIPNDDGTLMNQKNFKLSTGIVFEIRGVSE